MPESNFFFYGNCSERVSYSLNPPLETLPLNKVTPVTYTATDAAGHTATCSDRWVLQPLAFPGDEVFEEGTEVEANANCQATVGLDISPCFSLQLLGTDPPLPRVFGVGIHRVQYTFRPPAGFSDDANSKIYVGRNIKVVDKTPPVIQCAGDVTLPVQAGCAVSFNQVMPTATDCSGPVTITSSPPMGTMLGLGPHTITYTATDAAGNTSTCTQTVTVVDTASPTITCPADLTESCATASGATVSYTATTTDNCDPAAALTCSPASGSTFPLGTTVVTCTATDAGGNTSTCSFMVTAMLNNPPTANAGGDQDIHTTEPGLTVTLNGAGSSDPDGQPLTYAWTQTSGPAVTLDDPTSPTPSYSNPTDYQSRVFQLTVTDPCGVTATDAVSVLVRFP
ncbi:MAG: HYR domain-containing protein [Acidobacteria bacterium]|nr:HYR domain-containing protein [Acidobacteriota bacterium]